ncbi:MAG: tetratricopeptide repeat protein [Bdellovibrionales bacterium]
MDLDSEIEKTSKFTMILIATFLLSSLWMIRTWDKYCLDIIPLGLRDLLGFSTPSDWEAKAKICSDLHKWDCVEAQYLRLAQNETNLYVRLADLQKRRGKLDAATQNYLRYFHNGGTDEASARELGRLLAKQKRFDEAKLYFEMALTSSSEVLQIGAARDYVKMLIEKGHFHRARQLIEDVRHMSPAAHRFMEAEYQIVKKRVTASRD